MSKLRIALMSFIMLVLAVVTVQARAFELSTPPQFQQQLDAFYAGTAGWFETSEIMIGTALHGSPEHLDILIANLDRVKELYFPHNSVFSSASIDALAIYHVRNDSDASAKAKSSAAVLSMVNTSGDMRDTNYHTVVKAAMDYFAIHAYEPALPAILKVIEASVLPPRRPGDGLRSSYAAWWALANAADRIEGFDLQKHLGVGVDRIVELAKLNVYTGYGLTPDHMSPLLTRVLRGQHGGTSATAATLNEFYFNPDANKWMAYSSYYKAESIIFSFGIMRQNSEMASDIITIFEGNPPQAEGFDERNEAVADFARECIGEGDCDVFAQQPIKGVFGKIYGIHASFYYPHWYGGDKPLNGVPPEFTDTWVEKYGITQADLVEKWRAAMRAEIGNR